MKPNPGGQLAAIDILGRDQLIDEMWDILECRSIYMNDLRRIGKTMILNKMHEQPRSGWITSKCDLEGFHSAAEFATGVMKEAFSLLSKKQKTLLRVEGLFGKLAGIEIGGIMKLPNGEQAPWKDLLRLVFEDLEKQMEELDCRMVFLWDEVPFLLDNVLKLENPETAIEILDLLRALTQKSKRVRVVLTGSIGLHHILKILHGHQYSGEPVNHMEPVAPGPLGTEDALRLATLLIQGAGLTCEDPAACAQAITKCTGNVPFYIQKLVSRLPKGQRLTPASIETILTQEIIDANKGWELDHYLTRITTYYGKDKQIALQLLDCIAVSQPAAFDALAKAVRSQSVVYENEHLRDLLKLLERDYYIRKNPDKCYTFRQPLVHRWWQQERSL